MSSDNTTGLLHRAKERDGAIIRFSIDGSSVEARAGDTLLTAILLNGARLRKFEFGEGNRAGFCLMGACQDCWVRLEGGGRVRACSTLVADGMDVVTAGPRHV